MDELPIVFWGADDLARPKPPVSKPMALNTVFGGRSISTTRIYQWSGVDQVPVFKAPAAPCPDMMETYRVVMVRR